MATRTMTNGIGTIPKPGDAKFCAHCAWHDHHQCPGYRCECADQGHTPDDRIAAAMRLYQRPDLTGDDTRENFAKEWNAQ